MFQVRIIDGSVSYFITCMGPSATVVRQVVARRYGVREEAVTAIEETQPFPQDVTAS